MVARVIRLGPALLVMVLFAAACGDLGTAASSGDTDSPTSDPTPSRVSEEDVPSPRPLEIEGTLPLPGALELMPGDELMWVWTGESVTGVAPDADEPEVVVDLAFEFGGMVEAAGVLWFADFEANAVHRYDLAQRTWLPDVAVMEHPNRIAAHAGSVWLANGHGRWVMRLDAVTGDVLSTWEPLRQSSTGEEVASNAFWGTSADTNQAFAIDPDTNELTAELPTSFMPCAAQLIGESVWVIPCIELGLTPEVQVLAATGDAGVERRMPGWLGRVSAIGDRMWVPVFDRLHPDDGAAYLLALDAESLEAVDAVAIGEPVFDVVLAFDLVWLTTPSGLVRLEPEELMND